MMRFAIFAPMDAHREFPVQELNPSRTTWHITFGTYGARLHGDGRPTVDREQNHLGEAFIYRDAPRADGERDRMRDKPVVLPREVRLFIEAMTPSICGRGGWSYRACAAPDDEDHVHVMLDAVIKVHGKDVRKWLKRWLTEALDARFGRPAGGQWWAECGSTKAVKEREYLNNAFAYIERQRTTDWEEAPRREEAARREDAARRDGDGNAARA